MPLTTLRLNQRSQYDDDDDDDDIDFRLFGPPEGY
jgi:hypothetical protein